MYSSVRKIFLFLDFGEDKINKIGDKIHIYN